MEINNEFYSASDLFTWLIDPKNCKKYYYRGVNRYEQRYPTIMRTRGHDLSSSENVILQDFMRYGSSLVGNISNAFDCVAYAQHFGLPTRLVDWTRNPLIALFFSLYYEDYDADFQMLLLPRKNTLSIFEPVHKVSWAEVGISYRNPIRDYTKFIKQVDDGIFAELCIDSAKYLDDVSEAEVDKYSKKVTDNDAKGFMIMVDPGYSNSRILAQDGLFYFPRKLKKAAIDGEYNASLVETVKVDATFRTSLLEMLENAGISKYKLFFDLPTICTYIVEQAEGSIEQAE